MLALWERVPPVPLLGVQQRQHLQAGPYVHMSPVGSAGPAGTQVGSTVGQDWREGVRGRVPVGTAECVKGLRLGSAGGPFVEDSGCNLCLSFPS